MSSTHLIEEIINVAATLNKSKNLNNMQWDSTFSSGIACNLKTLSLMFLSSLYEKYSNRRG